MIIDTKTLRSLAERATQGPWTVQPHEHWKSGAQVYAVRAFAFIAECGIGESDAAYIAAASPDVVLALLDEVERLRSLATNFENQRHATAKDLIAMTAARDEALLDACRYSRLRVLGCAPSTSPQLANGTVLTFTNLDKFVDEDIKNQPSRGESSLRKVGGTP